MIIKAKIIAVLVSISILLSISCERKRETFKCSKYTILTENGIYETCNFIENDKGIWFINIKSGDTIHTKLYRIYTH
jgi:hypothetical protein